MSQSKRITPPPGQAHETTEVSADVTGRPAPEPGPADRATAADYPQLDGIEILLVEDDPEVLDAITYALEATGATVRGFDCARAAWASLQQRLPHVLVSDIQMPEEDGYALLRRLRAVPEARTIPAIALTGFTRREDEARVLAAGFDAHVGKPVEPEHLARVVLRALREHTQ